MTSDEPTGPPRVVASDVDNSCCSSSDSDVNSSSCSSARGSSTIHHNSLPLVVASDVPPSPSGVVTFDEDNPRPDSPNKSCSSSPSTNRSSHIDDPLLPLVVTSDVSP